jgi:hypothetical protein
MTNYLYHPLFPGNIVVPLRSSLHASCRIELVVRLLLSYSICIKRRHCTCVEKTRDADVFE